MIALAGILIASGLFLLERRRRYVLEKKIDQLIYELDRFLLTGESSLKESLNEGKVENLRNELAAVAAQARHQVQYREEREKRLNQFMENMAHQMKTSLTALQAPRRSGAGKSLPLRQTILHRLGAGFQRANLHSPGAGENLPLRRAGRTGGMPEMHGAAYRGGGADSGMQPACGSEDSYASKALRCEAAYLQYRRRPGAVMEEKEVRIVTEIPDISELPEPVSGRLLVLPGAGECGEKCH